MIRALASLAALAAASGVAGAAPASGVAADPAGDQELGAQIGMEMGGRVSPGGLHVLGSYLYRLSDEDWFEAGLSFTVGGGAAGCFRDRDDQVLCDHTITRGVGLEGFAGIRRFFAGQDSFSPYARAALGARLVSFAADDVTGFAIPLILGGGIRARVTDSISVVGGADLRLGIGWFNRRIESEPHLTLAIHAGAEFRL
jgi:hypothetical protein